MALGVASLPVFFTTALYGWAHYGFVRRQKPEYKMLSVLLRSMQLRYKESVAAAAREACGVACGMAGATIRGSVEHDLQRSSTGVL